jgi:membrane peptidoglycan carboxypeptidase
MIGASKQIAAAVWVGRAGDRGPIKEVNGSPMGGGGTPADIWEQFMEEAHAKMKLSQERFEPAKGTGDPNHPAANGQPPALLPAPPSDNDECENPLGFFCPQERSSGESGNSDDPAPPDNPGGQDPADGGDGNALLPDSTVRPRD